MQKPELAIVVAHSKNNVIGFNGSMPWHFSEDLKWFKQTTIGGGIIMGRKTFESIGRPLPQRTSIVISSKVDKIHPNVLMASSLSKALEIGTSLPLPKLFIVGGGEIYKQALILNLVNTIYLTEIDKVIEGDTFFPALSKEEWNYTLLQSIIENNTTLNFYKLTKNDS